MPPRHINPDRFRNQPLHLAPCIIGGEASDGDYVVICDDMIVARITRTPKSFGRVMWDWSITGPYLDPAMSSTSGSSASLDEAKQRVRAVFDLWVDYYGANPHLAVWHA